MKQVIATVISNKQILKELERPQARTILGSRLIWLRCPEIAQEAKPGQFVMVNCGPDCVLPRPFSIHQLNEKGDVALFYAVWADGKGTNWLSKRQVSDNVELFGSLGNGFSISPTSKNLLLVAGGNGIAPLYFLAQQAVKKELSVTLLRGASGEKKPSGERNPSQHYPKKRLPKGIEVHTVTSRIERDKVTHVVSSLIPKHADRADQVFACGPLPMYKTMAQIPELKNKPVQVSLEVRMGCGRGVCYGCTIKTKQGLKKVCQDGPVFDLDDILWNELNLL